MIHEIAIVLIYATFVMLLVNYYTKRVDKLEDRIIDLENQVNDIKSNIYVVNIEEGNKKHKK